MPAGFYAPSSEIEPIVGIQICVFSPEEIERRSVVEITNAGTYEGNEPKIGGLFDPRMGVLDNGKECRSCGQTNHKCPGHFGHFRLARPVYYIQFLPFVQNILSCVCIRCSKLLIDKKYRKHYLKRRGEARYREVLTACKEIKRCGQETEDGCGARQPDRFIREGIARIVAEWDDADGSKEKQRQSLEVEYVLRLFRRITDEDVDFMGLNRFWCRPDWMICTVLPIPPPQVRPSVIQDNNQRSEDDLTHKLAEIIKTNNTYLQPRIEAGAAKSVIDEWTNVLQYHIATLVDNQIPGVAPSAQRNGRPLKSIQQRLGSKEGRIRYNIQGKRVEFSARSVITPDPNISIAELGVPEKIAMNLTFPERVTKFSKDHRGNMDKLYRLVQNGPNTYPGAKTIRHKDGRITSLRHVNTKELVLHEGDIVNRHLMDGDIVLFNRQPTLHRMSMMGHRVKVLKGKTFRLNVSVTAPYNADFDGDEMNMHCPQSYEAATELDEIAAVPHQILRPRDGLPVIGIVQDTLVGSYRLTRDSVNFNRREFMNLMMWNRRFNGAMPLAKSDGGRWSGRQVLSQLMPPINLDMMNSSKKKVVIREGEILEGQFDKSIYSKASKGIIHMTYKDYGSKDTVDMIDALQNTIEQFLVYNGFSVGISDLIADSITKDEMNKKIQEKKSEVETILLQIHQDLFDNNTGKSNQSEFEDKVFGTLNKATETAGEIGQNSLANENRMTAMVRAGSKGGPINIAQMIACVGQQNIEGKRIPNGFEDRTLPHFKKYDDGAEARGFIENSFITGLTPTEFFFHAMSGREGLIDTAVKSIKYDTTLIIYDGKSTKRVKAGEWIDSKLAAANQAEIEYYPNDANMELLKLTEEVFIPTTDENGKVSWGQMTAITRHDPGQDLYEIRTRSGRDVTVTASKSLLIWNADTKKFEPKLTGDVKIGDCVPVTSILGAPPEVKAEICISDYLRKDEFLYGTDYRVAADLFAEKDSANCYELNRWWKEHNGTTFTLPYKKFNDFRLSLKRTNMMEIQKGFVYSWCKPDAAFMLPEFLPLNERTGILIGLYVADGNADIASGYIQITKNDPVIRTFARQWFEEMGVTCRERVEQRPMGLSSDVRGFSTVLAKLFIKMCGKGSAEKRIPHECFGASDAFVRGFLNGYFSGDGCIAPNGGIQSSSVSQELTEGVAMMCSRIGVFAKLGKIHQKTNNALPAYTISIRAQWATRFAEQITLLNVEKRDKLAKMSFNTKHMNYIGMNDVVLDTITEITWIDPSKHPKMYDVTVPSTLNFALANGLQVRDTADTGYIQRQLVKAMEDLVVHHDGTVRDANMNITQLHYGEDGINSTKIESLNLEISKFTDAQLASEFGLEGMDLATILGEGVDRGNDTEALAAYVAEMKADRKMFVEGVFRKGRQGGVFAAVNLERLIFNIKTKFGLTTEQRTNLTPLHVLKGIAKVLENTQKFHKMWAALLRYYLAPAKLIVQDRFTESAFDTLCEMLITKNWQAWVQPGELVGIIAAQSIGEPSTQMSCVGHAVVIAHSKKLHYKGPVGFLIDKLLEENKKRVITIGKDSVVLDLDDDLHIMGVSNNEKTSWKRISQVSRHPANGGLVEVHTRTGRKTTATLSHSFLKRATNGIVPVLGSDLKIGMRIPVATYIPVVSDPIRFVKMNKTVFTLDKQFGWVCGIYLADGSMHGNSVKICKIHPVVEEILRKFSTAHGFGFETKHYEGEYGPGKDNIIKSKDLKDFLVQHFNQGSYVKSIDYLTYHAPLEFIQGVIGGYFDGDGNVNADRQQIRISSRSQGLIRDVNRLLGYCGMFGLMGQETSVLIPDKVSYTMNIPRKYAEKYKNTIGFELQEKAAALDVIIAYMNREDKHDTKDLYDKIPEVGEIIAQTGKLLRMPGQSRNYGRWIHKESVGRQTLRDYISNFKEMMNVHMDDYVTICVQENIEILQSAVDSDVMWDEIVELVYLDDPKEFVYDFTVPGNDSFMVDDSIMVHNTLNSVDWDTKIMISKNGKILTPQIGEFIDACLDADVENIQEFPNKQLYLDLKDGNDWKAISCDENGKMMWTKLEAVTRHPVVNEDGSDTILEVELASGRVVKATKGKSFLTERDGKVQDINGSDLKVGDLMPIANTLEIDSLGYVNEISGGIVLDRSFGYSVGLYLTGIIDMTKEENYELIHSTFKDKSSNIVLPDWVFQAPDDFVKGVINGYMNSHTEINSSNKELIVRLRTLLSRYRIFSIITETNDIYKLQIPDKYAKVFSEIFTTPLTPIIKEMSGELNDIVWDAVKSIKEVVPITGWVYDLTVETTRNFMTEGCHVLKDTFHLAGVASKSNVTRGVPRLKEVLKVTQNPKATSLTIPLLPEYANNKTKAREVAQELELTLLRDMTVKTAIYYDPKDSQSILKEDRELLAFYKMFEMGESTTNWSKYILRIELDRQRMFDRNITMDDINFVLRERLGGNINIIYSDFNSQKLVMRLRLSPEYMEETKTDPSSMDMMSAYKKFQNKLLNSVIIRGFPGIKAATFRKGDERYVFNEAEGKYETREEYILDTDGSNFLEVMNHPAVDATRVYSTHVHDVYMLLGIEAARATLYNEIQTLFEEGQINYRHLGLLVDVMCRAGRLMSVDRYGINKLDIGPLAKASFEETERILLKAAVFGEMDPITGVSANIMTGQPIRAGTAFSDILLDEVAVLRLQKGLPAAAPLDAEDDVPTEEQVDAELFQDVDDICSTNRLRLNIALPKATTLIEDEPDVEIAVLEDDE